MDDAEQAWYDRQEEKIEEALELAWRSQITYPWFFDFFEYFDEKIVQHHEERDEFLQHYRDRNSEQERVFDRDDIRHVDSIYDAVCDECDTVQFSLRGFEDATYCNSCYDDLDFDSQDSLSSFDNETYVLVGCGKQKDATGISPAKDIYSSSYFEKKQGFAEAFSDEWYIVSGKFGLLHNETTIWDYDASIEDVDTDEWMDVVEDNLDSWLDWNQGDEVYVLIGRKYLDAEAGDGRTLRSLLTEAEPETYFPFEQTSGIGKQKQYLGEAVEYGQPVMPYSLPGFEDQTALDSF